MQNIQLLQYIIRIYEQIRKITPGSKVNFILNEFELSKSINSEDVIKNSISTLSIAMSVQIWIDQWFNREFNHANQHFNVALIKLKFNDLGLHSQKFEIINTVNDPQFTQELKECMTVFEHEYYYPAAAVLVH